MCLCPLYTYTALGDFLLPLTIEVTFTTDLAPRVNVIFKVSLIIKFSKINVDLCTIIN